MIKKEEKKFLEKIIEIIKNDDYPLEALREDNDDLLEYIGTKIKEIKNAWSIKCRFYFPEKAVTGYMKYEDLEDFNNYTPLTLRLTDGKRQDNYNIEDLEMFSYDARARLEIAEALTLYPHIEEKDELFEDSIAQWLDLITYYWHLKVDRVKIKFRYR